MTNSRLIYCYDPNGKSEPNFMILEALKNTGGKIPHQMIHTPSAFQYFKLDKELSFFVQNFIVHNVQYSRIIAVDGNTQKPVSTLDGLENDIRYYCEIGALTEFVGTDATTFYYIDPKAFVNDTVLNLYSETYSNKRELFIDVLGEYRNQYINAEFYAQPLLCGWLNWSINNITTLGRSLPINEFPNINNNEIVTTSTVVDNEQDKSSKVVTYASVAATAPCVMPSKKSSMITPSVSKDIASKTLDTAALLAKRAIKKISNERMPQKREKSVVIAKDENHAQKKINSSISTIKSSPFSNVENSYKRFSFAPLFEMDSSDDEFGDDNKQSINRSKSRISNRKNDVRGSSAIIASNSKKSDYEEDEDTYLNRCYALANKAKDEAIMQNKPSTSAIIASDAEKAAVRRADALSAIVPSTAFILTTPMILNMLTGIIGQTKNDISLDNNDLSKKLTLALFYTLYSSQVFCTLYASNMIKSAAKQYIKNQPVLNSIFYGYEASKQSKVNNAKAIEDKAKEDTTEKPKARIENKIHGL